MAFVVKYNCTGCGHKWTVKQPKSGMMDPCPECAIKQTAKGVDWEAAAGTPYTPRTNAGKAVDYMWKTVQDQYGLTDMKDNMREGDIAAKVSNPVSQQIEKQGGFFTGGTQGQAIAGRQSAMDMAAAARAERKSQGINDAFATGMNAIKNTPSIIQQTRANPVGRAKLQ